MRMRLAGAVMVLAMAVGIGMGACGERSTKSPDVTGDIRKALDQANLNAVSVSQDRDLGVVTLKGTLPSADQKSQAETIAKSYAGTQVVSDQIAVVTPGAESDSKTINSDLDKGIKANLDAALTAQGLNKVVDYDVNNGVVTLTGNVNSEHLRAEAERVAKGVPNVKQVVNKLQIRKKKATTS
jgi:hyperosmotically inducible protein